MTVGEKGLLVNEIDPNLPVGFSPLDAFAYLRTYLSWKGF